VISRQVHFSGSVLYSGDSESPFSVDSVNIYLFYDFSERNLVTLFKDYRPDGMIQCGAESNLNIGGICRKVRVSRAGARWASKAHRGSNISLNRPRSTSSQSTLPPLE
jgi:hypothetical protein